MSFFDHSLFKVGGVAALLTGGMETSVYQLSTFSKAAALFGGLETLAAYQLCAELKAGGKGQAARTGGVASGFGSVGDATCSTECDGRRVVYSI